MTYSFPCQDLSLAGKRKGMSDTSTRSGLLWEVERILDECEAFRLMGVKDEDYDKLTCSDSQKYKQAGNSIVVNVLMAIFKELLKDD